MPMFLFGMLVDLTDEQRERLAEQLGIELRVHEQFEPRPPGPTPAPPPGPTPVPSPSVGPHFDAAPGYAQALIRREWPAAAWEHAAAIAYCESGWRPDAHNTAGEDSRGLWQINVVPQANIDLLSLGNMFDPSINAKAAAIVWRRQGWRAWLNCARIQGVPTTGAGIP